MDDTNSTTSIYIDRVSKKASTHLTLYSASFQMGLVAVVIIVLQILTETKEWCRKKKSKITVGCGLFSAQYKKTAYILLILCLI